MREYPAYRMSRETYSLSALERERDELRRDYRAFGQAYEVMRSRLLESSEVTPARHPELHTWSGTRAVVGSLEMAIHAVERTIIEYGELINKIHSGEADNSDPVPPRLTLVGD